MTGRDAYVLDYLRTPRGKGSPKGSLAHLSPVELVVHLQRGLVNRAGKALLERQMARSRGTEYAAYVARTGGFLPRPPRRDGSIGGAP